jgi:hypothetical protein
MTDLIQDASEDGNSHDDDKNNTVPTQAAPPTIRQSRTAAQRHISLALLFSFMDPSSATLFKFYWKGGLKNMQWENAGYDIICEGAEELTTYFSTSMSQQDSDVASSGILLQ